jgi:predicted dinucleotide-binding enzyme
VTDDPAAGEVTRELIADAGFKPVNAGPLHGARQLEQVGVLLHHIADHEYGGDADLIRLAFTVVEASADPIVRERIA